MHVFHQSTRIGTSLRALAAALLVSQLAACVQVQPHRSETPAAHSNPRVLLMPPDILVLEVSAAGPPFPHPDWTAVAEEELVAAAEGRLRESAATLVRYRPAEGVVPYAPAHLPAIGLHEVVLDTVLTYHYGAASSADQRRPRLATKGDHLAWTLGDSVRPLREDYDADYALFILYHQATSTGGRALLAAAGFVLFGAIGPTSQSIGLASLVDLHSGEIVWTNVLQGQAMDVSRPNNLDHKGRELLAELPL